MCGELDEYRDDDRHGRGRRPHRGRWRPRAGGPDLSHRLRHLPRRPGAREHLRRHRFRAHAVACRSTSRGGSSSGRQRRRVELRSPIGEASASSGRSRCDPELWNKGIARRLMATTMELFSSWGTRHIGLFTFAQSPKHVRLYQSFGFWPRFLTAVMDAPVVAPGRPVGYARFSDLAAQDRSGATAAAAELTGFGLRQAWTCAVTSTRCSTRASERRCSSKAPLASRPSPSASSAQEPKPEVACAMSSSPP